MKKFSSLSVRPHVALAPFVALGVLWVCFAVIAGVMMAVEPKPFTTPQFSMLVVLEILVVIASISVAVRFVRWSDRMWGRSKYSEA
jgi:hypothetical protein